MKKFIKVFSVILLSLLIVGCTTETNREDVLTALKDEKIIGDKWKLVDTVQRLVGGEWFTTDYYDYIYNTPNGKYIIRIDNSKKHNSDTKTYAYKVEMYKVSYEAKLNTIPEEEKSSYTNRYRYMNREEYYNSKYIEDENSLKKYLVASTTKSVFIFSKTIWNVKEVTNDSN